MHRDQVLQILRAHEPELKAAGLLHLRLFGSVARGEETPDSDVDLFFDWDKSESMNLFGAYGYQDRVTEILGVSAHLSCADNLRPELRDDALAVTIGIF